MSQSCRDGAVSCLRNPKSCSMQAFSRFYFVGDEDLLEIVGNANEPAKVAQHLGKMFASVGALNMPTGPSVRPSLSLF